MRYRYLYPRVARILFPVPAFIYDLPIPSQNKIFNEATVAHGISRERLLQEAEDLCRHRFVFLNLPIIDLGKQVDWRFIPDGDLLWRYTLHYGEWAQTLTCAYLLTKEVHFRDSLVKLITDWVDHNPVCSKPGWEPYPVSRRLVSWSKVALCLREDSVWNSFWQTRLAPSLHQQVRVLAANLEHDLSNNHLLANYRALAWMGLLFPKWPEADAWRSIGLNGLWSEMRRQVLPDGVHDERSISYHTVVLQDLLETWYLCRVVGEEIPEDVEPTLMRMFQFLADIQGPDGSYPMFNDSVNGYPMDPRSVLLAGGLLFGWREWVSLSNGADPSYALSLTGAAEIIKSEKTASSRPMIAVYPEAGYVILKDERENYLYFDAGPMGPDHLPGHGHADALSFVLYGGGRPLIVDPGVFSYHDKQWRNYFRSTMVHNTVTVDGQDQCVFWGNFRVAYPPKVCLVEWSEDHAVGEHEGYCRLRNPVLHRRRIEKKGSGEWVISDFFEGKGEHDFHLTLQFAAGAEVKNDGGETLIRWPDNVALKVIPVSTHPKSKVIIENGWVSTEWNLKENAPRYAVRWRSNVPVENHLILRIFN